MNPVMVMLSGPTPPVSLRCPSTWRGHGTGLASDLSRLADPAGQPRGSGGEKCLARRLVASHPQIDAEGRSIQIA
jgi:hypothetical protein